MFIATTDPLRYPTGARARGARALAALAAMLLLGAPAPAAAAPLQAVCSVHFTGTSTLHDFHGTAPSLTFPVEPGAVSGHWKAEATVQVSSLGTDNGTRDANMWAMFDAQHWPLIRASFADIDPTSVATDKRLAFQLTIRDVTRSVVATIESWQQDSDKVTFDATFDVSLAAFGLKAPSVLGLVHVQDSVAVAVHTVVTRTATER